MGATKDALMDIFWSFPQGFRNPLPDVPLI